MNRWLMTALVGCLVSTAGPLPTLRADENASDVLAAVPGDAWAVLAVRHTADLDKKLTTLTQQLVNQPISPLSMLKGHLGLLAGVKDDGGFAVFLMPSEAVGPDMTKHVGFLVPTSDFKQLLAAMEPEDAGDGLSRITLAGETTYAASTAGYAVFGPTREFVKGVLDAKSRFATRCSPYQLKRFGEDDLSLFGNAEDLIASKAIAPLIGMLAASTKMDTSAISDLRTVQISLRLDAKAVRLGVYTEFKPGSASADVLSSQSGTEKSLLVGLPKEKYALAAGSLTSKEAVAQAAKAIESAIGAVTASAGADAMPAKQMVRSLLAILGRSRGVSVSVSALPEGALGMIGLAVVISSEDGAKAALADVGKLVESINALIAADQGAKIEGTLVELTSAAEKSGDYEVSKLAFNTGKIKDLDETAKALIKKVFGDEGIVFRLAAIGGDRLAVSLGGGAARMQTVIGLVKDGQAPLDEDAGIQRSRESLPKSRNSEFYLAADQMFKLVKSIAKAADAELPPIPVPEIAAPLAVASAPAGKGASQTEIVVPMDLIMAVRDVVMQSFMGGMGRGGPPPAPPKPPA